MMCELVERDLDAYIDRELDRDAETVVRSHVEGCASCQHRVAERLELSRLIRSAPFHPAPDRLRARVSAQLPARPTHRRLLTWAAAAVLAISAGTGIMLMRSATTSGDALIAEAVNDHVRSLMAEHLFDVQSTDQHTVKPWFLGRLDFSPPVTDLAAAGFPLVGGRLDYLGGRPVAALVYQRQKHTINVFIAPEPGHAASRVEEHAARGFHVRHWTQNDMTFWAVSDLNDAELTEFVRALQGR
jgi:anti-sigma factor RsiW